MGYSDIYNKVQQVMFRSKAANIDCFTLLYKLLYSATASYYYIIFT